MNRSTFDKHLEGAKTMRVGLCEHMGINTALHYLTHELKIKYAHGHELWRPIMERVIVGTTQKFLMAQQ